MYGAHIAFRLGSLALSAIVFYTVIVPMLQNSLHTLQTLKIAMGQ